MALFSQLLPGLSASPDVHPLVVHFPVALFPVAVLFAILALWRGPSWLRFARWLVGLGTAAAAVAVVTGLEASRRLPHGPGTLVREHRTIMIVAAGLAAVIWLVMILARRREDLRTRSVIAGGLLVLNGVIAIGADRGALVALRYHVSLGGDLPSGKELRDDRTSAGAAEKAVADAGRGRSLYEVLRCAGCHEARAAESGSGIPPALDAAGSRYQTAWLQAYLQRPHRRRWAQEGIRPALRMPDFQLDAAEAADLAAFLAARLDTTRFPPIPLPAAGEADAGRDLFRQYACRGCHRLGGAGGSLGPALDGVGSRLTPAFMFAFLENPQEFVPGTAMTDFGLWDEEARQLVAYLAGLDD